MWPFKRKRKTAPIQFAPTQAIQFSQVDTTERFGDNATLAAVDWIETVPLNSLVPEPESMGLPPAGAADEEVYQVAARMSRLRESIQGLDDGVYCPICHLACVDYKRIRTPCPKCGRPLLAFGWD